MSYKYYEIVVVDIESTCWESDASKPLGEEAEIIEIGIAALAGGDIVNNLGIIVKPIHSTISPFCTELTTLTEEYINQYGIEFTEALDMMRKEYHTRDRVWASWGEYDKNMFKKQCEKRNLPYPFGNRHINIKTLFTLMYNLPKELGLNQAYNVLGWSLSGTHHRGCDDAYNIARVLKHLLCRGDRDETKN